MECSHIEAGVTALTRQSAGSKRAEKTTQYGQVLKPGCKSKICVIPFSRSVNFLASNVLRRNKSAQGKSFQCGIRRQSWLCRRDELRNTGCGLGVVTSM